MAERTDKGRKIEASFGMDTAIGGTIAKVAEGVAIAEETIMVIKEKISRVNPTKEIGVLTLGAPRGTKMIKGSSSSLETTAPADSMMGGRGLAHQTADTTI